MTAYVVAGGAGSSVNYSLSVMPGTYPIRIARIEANMYGAGTTGGTLCLYNVIVYPSSTVSGGTAITPYTMRQLPNTPASTATAKSGGTISGTNIIVHSEESYNISSSASAFVSSNLSSNYSFPFDLILSSGSTLQLAAQVTSATINSLAIYYEELHEPWAV